MTEPEFTTYYAHRDCALVGQIDPEVYDGVLWWWCQEHGAAIPREWGIERRDAASLRAVQRVTKHAGRCPQCRTPVGEGHKMDCTERWHG